MGIHLCCQTLDYKDHPDWDWIRYAGDRDFVSMLSELPKTLHGSDNDFMRPTDFKVWREAVAKKVWPNPGRIERLLNLLEADTGYFIYVSW